MPLVDIEEFQKKVLDAKCKGVSITETLRNLGIPRATYYRALGEIAEPRWRQVKDEKILTRPSKSEKIKEHLRRINEPELESVKEIEIREPKVRKSKSQKIDLGMSGGNLQEPENSNSDFIKGMASMIKDCEKQRKKFDEQYIK